VLVDKQPCVYMFEWVGEAACRVCRQLIYADVFQTEVPLSSFVYWLLNSRCTGSGWSLHNTV
jgi:hypothetical protein